MNTRYVSCSAADFVTERRDVYIYDLCTYGYILTRVTTRDSINIFTETYKTNAHFSRKQWNISKLIRICIYLWSPLQYIILWRRYIYQRWYIYFTYTILCALCLYYHRAIYKVYFNFIGLEVVFHTQIYKYIYNVPRCRNWYVIIDIFVCVCNVIHISYYYKIQ